MLRRLTAVAAVVAAVVALVALGVGPASGQSGLSCLGWSDSASVGMLDETFVSEASGLEVASSGESLYLINDSGDSGRFFLAGTDGGQTRAVGIRGPDPTDTEDMTLGRCPDDAGRCLFFADIGDNEARRTSVKIVVVREQASFPPEVTPERRFRVRYPDGPRDAESLAIHPNGDLFILTKMPDYAALRVSPSALYRIPYSDWAPDGVSELVAEPFGELDLTAISSDPFSGSLATGMDISDDGARLLVLTYMNAFEFDVDLSAGSFPGVVDMVEGEDYREIALQTLEQQESIAYLPSGDGFLYTTESGSSDGSPIMRVSCFR